MSRLYIKIDITKLTDYSVSLKKSVGEKTLLMMIEEFSKYVANLCESLIEEAIDSNRYKGVWEPLEEEGYKEYLGTNPTGDILEYIKEALEVEKIGYHFVIRINPKYKYPGSKLSLEKVVTAIDSGTSKFNSRPILRSIVNSIQSHLLDLWRGYKSMKGAI